MSFPTAKWPRYCAEIRAAFRESRILTPSLLSATRFIVLNSVERDRRDRRWPNNSSIIITTDGGNVYGAVITTYSHCDADFTRGSLNEYRTAHKLCTKPICPGAD